MIGWYKAHINPIGREKKAQLNRILFFVILTISIILLSAKSFSITGFNNPAKAPRAVLIFVGKKTATAYAPEAIGPKILFTKKTSR